MRSILPLLLLVWSCSDCEPDRAAEQASVLETPADAPARGWVAIDPPAAPGSLGLDLRADEEGVTATWLEPSGEGHAIRLATLERERWSEPSTVVEGDDLVANWADFPRSRRGGDGARYVHGLHRSAESPYAYAIRLYRMVDDEVSPLGVVHRDGTPTEHGFVSMVPTDDGVRLYWLDGRATADGGATAIRTATVSEGSIGTEAQLDERVCDCCQTDAALTASGPVVAYRDRSEGEHRDIALMNGNGERIAVHDDGWEIAGCPVNGPAVDAEGDRVVVAWFTGAHGGSVKLAFSEDAGESFGEPIVVDGEQPPGRVDVALVNGGAAVSWLARSDGRGEVRTRFVPGGGPLGRPLAVGATETARASGFPVMARDGERLLVGYRDGSERLRVRALPLAELPREPGAVEARDDVRVVEAGDALPEGLELLAEDDSPVTVDVLAGEGPLLVAFFARWCQPCRQELATLEAFRAAHDELTVVAVSLDEGPHAQAEATARRWGFEGRVLRDGGAATALAVPPLPAIGLVRDGRIDALWRGEPVATSELEQALAPDQ